MISGSFDPVTCREIIGDTLARSIEDNARKTAEFPETQRVKYFTKGETYWDQCQSEMEDVVWLAAFQKRKERIKRKNDNG